MTKTVKIQEIQNPKITVGSARGLSSDVVVYINDEPLVTVHYVYPWIDNTSQYSIAEKIAKLFETK